MPNNVIFNRYKIIKEIGNGGMATVYSAIDLTTHNRVALKIINAQLTTDREYVERFHREAKLIAQLGHPNIVSIFEHGEMNGVHFIAMEFLDGIPLSTHIKNKRKLSLDETLQIILPILKALHYAHEKGIIHRDIKSANIFITKNKRPVLLDFGIAHVNSGPQLTRAGAIFGTPEYMSPEQAQGEKLDQRSDIYSVGMVMYECLTGVLPFTGTNPITVIHKIIYEKPYPLQTIRNDLPPNIYSVVQKALAYLPEHRFSTAMEFYKALVQQPSNLTMQPYPNSKLSIENYYVNKIPDLNKNLFVFSLFTLFLGFIESMSIQSQIGSAPFLGALLLGMLPASIGTGSVLLTLKLKTINSFLIALISNLIFLLFLLVFTMMGILNVRSIFLLMVTGIFVAGIGFSSLLFIYALNTKELKLVLLKLVLLILLISFFMMSVKNFFIR